jgi:hypothetical protein
MQMVHFWKNISMAGGALLLTYFGPGPYSVRARSTSRDAPPAAGVRAQWAVAVSVCRRVKKATSG